mmetsp:Transcript_8201/g.9093  ORF Transcript_8201/g.9093 Transcript_8201/m.9093 type:complete len:367 (+) Transcript_8201:330-1430(+)
MVTRDPNPIDLKGLIEGHPANIEEESNQGVPYTIARLIVDCRCHLGECVIWDDRQNAVVFTSILERKFHKLVLASYDDGSSEKLQSYELPKMLCAFGLLQTSLTSFDDNNDDINNDNNHHIQNNNNPGYIVAWEDGFQVYDLEGGKELSLMSRGEVVNRSGLPDRLNDGRVDPTGKRFVCGGCAANSESPLKVYKCEYDSNSKTLTHSVILNNIVVTNSICWSLDGNEMYIANSPCRTIRKFVYDQKAGNISNEQLMHTKRTGFPDGSVVDSQGYVWNATWRQGEGTGMVDRIDPVTGELVFTVYLPDKTSEASCCCFGGTNLDILFITTAFENIDRETEPHAGGLYAVKLPPEMRGCEEKRFRFD